MAQQELFDTTPEEPVQPEPSSAGNKSAVDYLPAPFRSLNEFAQMVGFALAWVHEPIATAVLTKRMAMAGIFGPSGKPAPVVLVRDTLQQLFQRGIVDRRDGGGYFVQSTVSHYLVACVYERPDLLAALKKLPLTDYAGREHYLAAYGRYRGHLGKLRVERDLRQFFYEEQDEQMLEVIERVDDLDEQESWDFVLHPFQGRLLQRLPAPLFRRAISMLIFDACDELYPAEDLLWIMVDRAETVVDWQRAGELAILRADWTAVERIEEGIGKLEDPLAGVAAAELAGARAFIQRADDAAAIDRFEESLAQWRKATRKRKGAPAGLFAYWFIQALLRRGHPEDLVAVTGYADLAAKQQPYRQGLFEYLREVGNVLSGTHHPSLATAVVEMAGEWMGHPMPGLFDLTYFTLASLVAHDDLQPQECIVSLENLTMRATQFGAGWVAAEASALRDYWSEAPSTKEKARTEELRRQLGEHARSFAPSLKLPEQWERTVIALETLGQEFAAKPKKKSAKKKAAAQKQLIWCLDVSGYDWDLSPYERSVTARGKISKGRKVALKRLKERQGEMAHLTDQDRRIVMQIKRFTNWSGQGVFELSSNKVLLDVAGHPLLFSDKGGTKPLELVKAVPRLEVTETDRGTVKLALTPQAEYEKAEPMLEVVSPTRCIVLDVQDVHVRLHKLLSSGSHEVPIEVKDRVVKALGVLSEQLAIESDESTLDEVGVKTVEAVTDLVLRLFPHGEGLHVQILVRPVRGGDATCEPGSGKALVVAEVDGQRVQAGRNLKEEERVADEILALCPTLERELRSQGKQWSTLLEEPLTCLQFLGEVAGMEEEICVVEWPEGQSYRVQKAEESRFQVSLGGNKDWLTATGNLGLDNDEVLSMRELLDQLDESEETPGFVKLKDGSFLALSDSFRRQLEDLQAFSQKGKGETVRIHPLAALAMEELASEDAVKVGAAWKKQLARLQQVDTTSLEPPSTLQAELRPYQVEGYRWLRRLADWGFGGCLADDMGLGKTVQTLALLLDRAPDGPALVVAPTSVAANWLEEAIRFAPTLRPILFGRSAGNRKEQLQQAGPFDLVIASYGLLQSEEESFAAREWHTVILDEAQAIKNRATKRSQAAMKIPAAFRLATTGTPVENRLAELHNLFGFINPGMLGTWDRFRVRLADPIERRNDARARERLRRLIRPFVLRRLKSEVLRDLPSRTEINLQVELETKEAAFYEALRSRAVEDLAKAEGGEGAIRILAELTRLRRACCHPKLVDPKSRLKSSKLTLFAELLEEILAGRHKVLVFSQFVDHLTLIRAHLKKEKISHQYLDGSTPAAKRQKAVQDFQAGKGDVFLISLKAGGFGLNLTAADYVIHMDPWWNPAAEDQASDRAHRIGQTRPVTIYRLITAGTIEEKIVDLHHRKRELADSILDGTDSAGRMTADELLGLLRGDG